MEEILSSIKRIIAEEGDATPVRGPRRQPRPGPVPLQSPPLVGDEMADDEVLELSDPMPTTRPEPVWPEPVRAERVSAPRPAPEPVAETTRPPEPAPPTAAAPIVSAQAAAASRGALDQLSRLMVKPEPGSDGTLEGMVREMLRPMLRDWLDGHLPALVEEMVQREIRRISGQAG